MIMKRRTWELIIIITSVVVDILKLFKDKFKNGGKKNDSSGSAEKK
jgi:hypothetical protein